MIRAILIRTLLLWACVAVAQAQSPDPWKSAAHRAGICGEIKKLDSLLYDNPSYHGKTATCSTSTDWIMVKPNSELQEERMRRFVLLAFAATGMLFNEDLAMPRDVYAGYGTDCQVMTTSSAALVNRELRRGDDSGMMHALQATASAKHVPCPK